ncbi:MAG: hypothetical protein ABJN69_03785 [Hellea sp.]
MALNKTSLITAALVAALPFLADVFVFGATGRAARILEEPGILIFNAGFAASPFILIGLIMAARKSVTRALWIGCGLTALLWAAYAGAGWSYHIHEKGGEISIAIFILMMVWPFIVTILMGVIGKLEPDRVSD